MHVTEIRKSASRYGEWLALHQVLAGSCMLQLSIYTCFGTSTTLSMLFQVLELWLLCTLERILFLAVAVAEINIKFETS